MKAHLLVFDGTQVAKDLFRDTLDGIDVIENWTLFFGNAMCLASKEDARTLSQRIRNALPKVRFLVVTVDPTQKGGWLPKELWQFMNEPSPVLESSDA